MLRVLPPADLRSGRCPPWFFTTSRTNATGVAVQPTLGSSGQDSPARSRSRRTRRCLASNVTQTANPSAATTLSQGAVPLLAAVHP